MGTKNGLIIIFGPITHNISRYLLSLLSLLGALRAKAIIELAMPVPLDNIEEPKPAPKPLHEETFDIGSVSSPEDIPEEPKMAKGIY